MDKKEKLLDELNKKCDEICKCALRHSATQSVPGEGSADADIMFIGEAPGRNEDIHGKPFIGAAGKFLDEMLETVKISREDVFITNIVKYRPPNNRDPLPKEVEDCRPWLEKQIKLIEPKLIVFLGRHSLNRFFPDEQISKVHGELLKKKFKNISVSNFFALYHPAAALYNGSLRETLLDDFRKIPKILKMIKKEIPEKSKTIKNK